jgi:hypothetical protein
MKQDHFWYKFKESPFTSVTIFCGALVLALNFFSGLSSQISSWTPTVTLAIVVLLATTNLLEQSRKLDRLETLIREGFDNNLRALKGAKITRHRLLHDGWACVADKIARAEATIYQAGLAPPTSNGSSEKSKYHAAVDKVLSNNKIRYRYIVGISRDRERLKKTYERLKNGRFRQYKTKYYLQSSKTCPCFSFIIIDEKEVLVYYPKDGQADEVMFAINESALVEMYLDYFQCLWNAASDLTKENCNTL